MALPLSLGATVPSVDDCSRAAPPYSGVAGLPRNRWLDPSESPAGLRRNTHAIIRLIGAVLLEANDEWQLQHRYMQTEAMAELTPPLIDTVPEQMSTLAA
jgi:hypothetical protein